MEIDESMSMGKDKDSLCRRTFDAYVESYADAGNGHQRAMTDRSAREFVEVLAHKNPKICDFWMGYYEGRKKELGLID